MTERGRPPLHAEIDRLTRELAEARAEIDRLRAAALSWERCADDARQENARLRAELTNARAAIYNLKDPDVSDWQFENSSLTQQIDAALGVEQHRREEE